MITPNIKDLVKNNTVQFIRFREGNFYYRVSANGKAYDFPVPLDDIGNATLLYQDKAMLFMRYMRKAIEQGTLTEIAQSDKGTTWHEITHGNDF